VSDLLAVGAVHLPAVVQEALTGGSRGSGTRTILLSLSTAVTQVHKQWCKNLSFESPSRKNSYPFYCQFFIPEMYFFNQLGIRHFGADPDPDPYL
jgi:hypothetical protein